MIGAVIIQLLFTIFVAFFVVFNCYEIINSGKNKKYLNKSSYDTGRDTDIAKKTGVGKVGATTSGINNENFSYIKNQSSTEHDKQDHHLETAENEPCKIQTEYFQPLVSILLPVCNEIDMIESLLKAFSRLTYSNREILLLDDSDENNAVIVKNLVEQFNCFSLKNNGSSSTSDTLNQIPSGLSPIKYCRRDSRKGFKSGNLQFGLTQSSGDLVAVFDADCIPQPDFFERTVSYFANEKLGFLQTAIDFRNRKKNVVTQFLDLEVSHKDEMTSGLSSEKKFVSLTGSSCIWRRDCLMELGGFHSETMTEDVDLCYRAQIMGWEYAYIQNVVSSELLPENISSLRVQRHRWACGLIKNAFLHTGRVIGNKELSYVQKFNAMMVILPSFLLLSFYILLIVSAFTVFLTDRLGWYFDVCCVIFLINTMVWGYCNVSSGRHNSDRKNTVRHNGNSFVDLYLNSEVIQKDLSQPSSSLSSIGLYISYVLLFVPMSLYYFIALIDVVTKKYIDFVPTPKVESANNVFECGAKGQVIELVRSESTISGNSRLQNAEILSLIYSFVLCVVSALMANLWIFFYGLGCFAGFMFVVCLSLKEKKLEYNKELKHVVITGATGEIGGALARIYAFQGRRLTLSGRNEQKLADLKKECEELGSSVEIKVLDLRNTDEAREWIDSLSRAYPVDLLIVNAGLNTNIGDDLSGEPFEEAKALVEVNLLANIALIDALLPSMRKRGRGQIAILSSLASYYGLVHTPTYCATKAALRNYGNSLRAWLKPEGIKVNVILPGYIDSPMCRAMPGPKPFLMKADKAVKIIKKGLERNYARISFPFPLNLGIWYLAQLPFCIASPIASLFGYGIGKKKSDNNTKNGL